MSKILNQKPLSLQPGTLWPRLLETTASALAAGALQPIPTEFEIIPDRGIRFLVRVLANLQRKDREKERRRQEGEKSGREFNPFLPYEEELFVTDITSTHLALLNKFNVLEHHLLIVTREFEDQEELLTVADFEALLFALKEIDGLAFYNGGVVAGASQRHKHLQLVPLPFLPGTTEPRLPVEPLIGEALQQEFSPVPSIVEKLPFVNSAVALGEQMFEEPERFAPELHRQYGELLERCGLEARFFPGIRQSAPYNLLVTREWMFLAPRSEEFFLGASVNSLGFAGALLVRNAAELEILKEHGPLSALEAVAVRR